jgi:hypothetical protein
LTEEARGFNNNNNTNTMNNNYDIKPGTDKFLRLHIDDLSKLTLNEMKIRRPNVNRSITPVIVTATITGFIIGIIAAYCLGLLPN